jgi:peptidoglycan/LPS O-acetylase OafA/YrhL
VITWRYDRRGPATESFLRGYFVNRFARIYPLYFLLASLSMLLGAPKSLRAWLLNLTVFSHIEGGIPQAWSLRVEECFYLAAPLVYMLWRKNPALPLGIAMALLAALYPLSRQPWANGWLGPPRDLFLYTFFGRFFEFYVGIWLAKKTAASGATTRSSGRSFPAFTAGGLAGIAGVVVALAAIRSTTADRHLYGVHHPAGIALNNLVLPLFIAAFYWGLIREASVVRRILSTRAADLLGRASYAFYLIHFGPLLDYLLGCLVLLASMLGAAPARATEGLLGNVGVRFAFVTLLSIALYAGIEAPANRLLRRRFGSARSGPSG